MLKKLFRLYVVLLFIVPITRAMQPDAAELLASTPHAPEVLEAKIKQFLAKKPTLVDVFSGASYYQTLPGTSHAPFSMNCNQLAVVDKLLFFEQLKMKLIQAGIRVPEGLLGYHAMLQNFIIPLDNNWLIKASGFLNRRANILHEVGLKGTDPELPQEKLSAFVANNGRTFQTISRKLYQSRAQQTINELHFDRVAVPEKYLVHLPERPLAVDDTNYIILERIIPNAKPILDTTLLEDEEVVRQMVHVIVRASLWNITSTNVLAKDDKAYIIDLEQPNNCPPSKFGRNDAMACGVEGLKDMIQALGNKGNKDVSELKDFATAVFMSLQCQ